MRFSSDGKDIRNKVRSRERAVHRSGNGKPLKLATNIDAYMKSQRAAAMASGAGRSGSLDCISLIN
jgi:hypothetical protein